MVLLLDIFSLTSQFEELSVRHFQISRKYCLIPDNANFLVKMLCDSKKIICINTD